MKKINIVLIIAILMSSFLSCERRVKQDVLMVYPNWADGIAITYLAKVILEDRGYKVTVKRLEPGPIFASLSRGDTDVYMDAWLPNTHKSYWDRFGKKLDVIGTAFDDGFTGLVVPDYVDVQSIDQLNANQANFDGKIYGIASGSGIYASTEKAIKAYNLNYEQLPSSETSMITMLRKAMANKEDIVITGWKPHYMWSKFKIKPLEDPKNVYPADSIKIVSRKGFTKDQPQIAKFYSNFNLKEDMLNELMDLTSENNDPEKGAKIFYEKYKEELSKF